jgi:quinol monooxygenase YgiN
MNVLHLLLGAILAFSSPWGPWSQGPQGRADTPADPTFYAVSYVEVTASSEAKAIVALKRYRDASRTEGGPGGYIRLDLFEQIGRPGHFAIVETWRDQKAFDAHSATARKPLVDALQPIRASDYDERPYKTLTVAPAPPASGRTICVIAHVDVSQDPRVPVMLKRLAEDSRREEGNVRFDVLQSTIRANHFTIVETWQSQKAFDAHVAAAHTRQYRDELQPLTGSPLDERVYKAVE